MRIFSLFMVLCLSAFPASAADTQAKRIVALGDSLTAGYGLQAGQDFATQLQLALQAEKYNVKIDNAGVSGDTSAGGRSRLDWAVSGEPRPSLVIVALGGNDLLRGLDPQVTRDNLDAILKELQKRNLPVLLLGMKSPTNLGPFYQKKFDAIYPDLADEYDVPLYPFFLQDVAMNPALNQADGVHPNPQGVAVMVKNILPAVEKALKANP